MCKGEDGMASNAIERLAWLAGVCAEGTRRHGTDARQVRAFVDRQLAELPPEEREALDVVVRRAILGGGPVVSKSRH
jgi:hypothetical protein